MDIVIGPQLQQLFMYGVVGIPLAVWSLGSLYRDYEKQLKICGECITCKSKANEERMAKARAKRRP